LIELIESLLGLVGPLKSIITLNIFSPIKLGDLIWI